jgi:spore maturation protein CgeB
LRKKCQEAKIVLNLHHYAEPSVLEQSRIVPLIANGCFVISEPSNDSKIDALFANMVVFAKPRELAATCRKYLGSNKLREEFAENALNYCRARFHSRDLIKEAGILEHLKD